MNGVRDLSSSDAGAFPAEWYEIIPEFWLDWRFRAFLAQVDALRLPRDAPWHGLDVGCGHGVVRRQIEAATNWTTDGADLNRGALEHNRATRGQTLHYDVRDRHPTFAGKYDFVLLFDVLEHIADQQAFLAAVRYHLTPGGWLFLNVPAIDRLTSRFDRVVGHLRRYDRRSLRMELARQGFAVRDLRYWGVSMLPYLVLRCFAPGRETSTAEVIEQGTHPPRPWMNRWIRLIMMAETAVLRRPPIGTSLLAAITLPT
jgi:SAM-dependent methyltransferase